MAPRAIIKGYRLACEIAHTTLAEISIEIGSLGSKEERRTVLEQIASTSMNSKLIHGQRDFFKLLVVDAVLMLDPNSLKMSLIGMKKIPGGAIQDSRLVEGVGFKKTFSYAGFEQQPKRFENPAILLLNVELELKAERDNAEVRMSNVVEYQAVVDAEWTLLYTKLEKIVDTKAQIVLSRLPIGDVATQFFAERGLFCAGRVPAEDMLRVGEAVGATMASTTNDLNPAILGHCGLFEEIQVGGERYNIFSKCAAAHSCTFLLRGGSEQFIAEVERSLHDAIMVVRRTLKTKKVSTGGGATEMALSRAVREASKSIPSKLQRVIQAFAKALEIIPRQLCYNAGLDAVDILAQLRKTHSQS